MFREAIELYEMGGCGEEGKNDEDDFVDDGRYGDDDDDDDDESNRREWEGRADGRVAAFCRFLDFEVDADMVVAAGGSALPVLFSFLFTASIFDLASRTVDWLETNLSNNDLFLLGGRSIGEDGSAVKSTTSGEAERSLLFF